MEMDNNITTEDSQTVEHTLGAGKANLIIMLMIIPVIAITLIPFLLIWDTETFNAGKNKIMDYWLLYLLGGAIIHELLHGVTLAYFVPGGLRSIKFGIMWKYGAVYCNCKEPIKVKYYRIAGAMPLIVLGIIPSIIGIIIGDGGMLFFGMFFIWGAGGDIIILYMLQKLDNNTYVIDHPKKIGFIRYL